MNADNARDDLAFMRSLVAAGSDSQKTFGQLYTAGGLCYGTQMLLHGGQALGLIDTANTALSLAIGLGPTVVFLVILIWILSRPKAQQSPTAVNRAVGAVFGSVGLTNLAFVVIFGSLAWRWHSAATWLIYPCVVMVLQGMAWMVAGMLRRRAWMGVVAGGWFATGIGMALSIDTLGFYIVIAGVGMIAFMLTPGLVMMRQTGSAAA
jgi:hypothetical protein